MTWRIRTARLALFTASVSNLIVPTGAQNQVPSDTVIRSSVREVVLEMTVRNKNEKLVRDLRPDEVEIRVDSVRQDVRSFQLVKGDETRRLESSEPALATRTTRREKLPPPNSAREINLVALVFRTGGTEERARAQKAALAFIAGEAKPNTYIAILTLTRGTTRVVRSFTSNTAVLADAINRTLSDSGMHQAGSALAALVPPGGPSEPVRGPGPTGGAIDATNAASSKLDASVATGFGALKVNQLESEALFMDATTEGRFEMDRYRDILNQMAGMPGRKTVVSMTTGLNTPPEQQEVFRKLIDDARRMGVTFYGVNLKGLGVASPLAAASTSVAAAAAVSASQNTMPAARGQAPQPGVTAAQATQDDRVLYAVTAANTDNALRILAESTGGIMIADTNDIAGQMPRIMDEVNTHYELSWSPTATRFDGKFHKIEVRLKRPGLHFTCREGYYALPDLNGREFQPFELTGLRELDSKTLKNDFEFRASALRFGPWSDRWHGVIAFEAPIASFSTIDPGSTFTLGSEMQVLGTAVALVKDVHGDIVSMVSDRVAYAVPADKKDGFLAGNLTMTLPVAFEPGVWTIEAAMMSPAMKTASTKRISVYVPRPATPAVSSITLARRIEPRKDETILPGPFDIGPSRVMPTLTNRVAGGADSQLFFVVYPSPEIPDKPRVVVRYFRDGRQVGQDSPLFRDDGSGAIPIITSAKLAPGDYEVRVTATQGTKGTMEQAWIRVEP